jgi:CHAT domain-containing protein
MPNSGIRFAALLSAAALAPLPVAADEDDDVRARIAEAMRDGRRDRAEAALDEALHAASQASQPVRMGRLELLRAELDVEHPTQKSVDSARGATLHLGAAPEAAWAAARYHVDGAAVTMAAGRLGAAALHIQEGRAALAPLLKPAAAAEARRHPDPHRDEVRLGESERALFERLRDLLAKHRDGAGLDAGAQAALACYVDQKPLAGAPKSDEPLPPKARAAGRDLPARLERAVALSEEKHIATAEARGDLRIAAAARTRHAETLWQLGRRDDAIKVRRQALAWYRASGTIDEVLAEDRWIAQRFEHDRRATLAARREVVQDIERALAKLAGPARAAMHARYLADYVALVEATAAALPAAGGTRPTAGGGGAPALSAKELAAAPLEAVVLVRDRSVWDEAGLLSDPARWKRLGDVATEMRKVLDGLARDEARRAHADESQILDDPKAPATRARQQVADALARGDAAAPPEIDLAALRERLKGRALVVYGRLDPGRLAIAALGPRGGVQLAIAPLAAADESAWVDALRAALLPRTGGAAMEGASDEAWHEPARKLYRAVIAPVEKSLVAEGTVIVPDGALAEAPFAVLEDGGGKLLGDRVALSFQPSPWALMRPAAPRAADTTALLLGISRSTEPGLGALAGADREASAAAATLTTEGWKPKLLPPTTSGTALAPAAAHFGVVQLTTRSRFDGDAPSLGYLVLAASRLFAFDLGGAAWRTNLLVLDGVGSAEAAPAVAARGLAGIVASALLGPAASVLVSDWPAAGPSSTALLCRFYERYAGGEPPAVALAGAQREMAAGSLEQPLLNQAGADPIADGPRFKHPRYWAPFALWGEP